jgi:hypothetical protein
MKLWLDDLRTPPDETWAWVTTVDEAKELLATGSVEEASLDNDLGDGEPEGGKLVLWMAEQDVCPTKAIAVRQSRGGRLHGGDDRALRRVQARVGQAGLPALGVLARETREKRAKEQFL